MRIRYSMGILITALLGGSLPLFSQVAISGPTCVMPGTIYHYKVSGPWKTSSTMQVCVSGGMIKSKDSSQTSCTAQGGAPLGLIQVVWSKTGTRSLTITSSEGNANLSISGATALQAGTMDTASQKQTISYDSLPAPIICGMDKGGSCSIGYTYQWQQSTDRVSWADINGATGKDLSTGEPMKETRFFRRKVTERGSGNIVYSDVAAVFVIRDVVIQ